MIRQEQCDKVCRILDDVLANRPTERDSLIVAVRKAFDALKQSKWTLCDDCMPEEQIICPEHYCLCALPSVQPERPTGEWIQKPRYEDDEYPDAQPNLKCPFCGYEIGWCDMGNYCARCGADLKGGAE